MAPLILANGLTTEWITSRPRIVASPAPRAWPLAGSIWNFVGFERRRQKVLSSRPPYKPITADIRWSWGSVTCFGAQITLRTVRSGALCSTWTPALSGSPIWRRREAGSETARATTSFKACRDRSASAARRSAMNWSRSNMGLLSIDDQLGIGEEAMPWQLASADLSPGPPPDTPGRRSDTTRRDRDRLADEVLVAPARGEAARALGRRAAAAPVHQVHRLARAVASVDSGQPATGALLERGLPAGRDRGPELGNIALRGRHARHSISRRPARRRPVAEQDYPQVA